MKKIRILNILFVAIIALFVLAFSVKGASGNPIVAFQHNDRSTVVSGPFESSNSTARYALTEAIAEQNSLFLSLDQAKFASPDVVRQNDKFISIFMPGISFIGVPFYLLGKTVGLPQLFAYLSVTLFGLLNMFLIARIAHSLGVNLYAGLVGGFIFLFGTNAFSYALSYTQHMTSVALLLISILAVIGKRTIWKNILFGVSAGMSLLIDVPNIIFLLPVGFYWLSHYIKVDRGESALKLSFNMKWATVLLGLIPFLVVFAWYNLHTTGSYTKIGQSIGRTDYFKTEEEKKAIKKQGGSAAETLPFRPRDQINGAYTLLISDERSWVYYSPIIWLGVLGFVYLYRRKRNIVIANMLIAVALLNVLVYSMFGDPWGGWSFGPRYLIPAAAMLCIGIAIAVQAYGRNIFFVLIFVVGAIYSLTINALGALTTNAIPPKQEAEQLLSGIPYTYLYNINLAHENRLSSLLYNLFFSNISSWTYIFFIAGILIITTMILYQLAVTLDKGGGKNER